jgi:hypothetical protein
MLIPDMLAQEYIHSDTRYIPLESDELMVDKLAVCTFCLYPWCYFFLHVLAAESPYSWY